MKKTLFPLLALIALASCSKSEIVIDDDTQPVPIQLTSGIGTVNTRAVVTNNATVNIGFWEHASAADYTGTTPEVRTANVGSSEASISLNNPVYYSTNDAVKTFIKGWYPAGTLAAGVVSFTERNGSIDVLLSNETSGSKNAAVSTALTFKHLLTQLKFKAIRGTGLASGVTLKSITVKGAEVPKSLALANNTLTYETVSTGLVAPITNTAIDQTTVDAAPVVGDALMIKPITTYTQDNNPLTLDIVAVVDGKEVTYTDKKFKTDDSKLDSGVAYTVALTFKQNGIELNASITPWTEAKGEGEII